MGGGRDGRKEGKKGREREGREKGREGKGACSKVLGGGDRRP